MVFSLYLRAYIPYFTETEVSCSLPLLLDRNKLGWILSFPEAHSCILIPKSMTQWINITKKQGRDLWVGVLVFFNRCNYSFSLWYKDQIWIVELMVDNFFVWQLDGAVVQQTENRSTPPTTGSFELFLVSSHRGSRMHGSQLEIMRKVGVKQTGCELWVGVIKMGWGGRLCVSMQILKEAAYYIYADTQICSVVCSFCNARSRLTFAVL